MCPNRCKGTGVIDSDILRDPGADSQGSQTGESGVDKVPKNILDFVHTIITQLTSTDLTFCSWVSKDELGRNVLQGLHSQKGDF